MLATGSRLKEQDNASLIDFADHEFAQLVGPALLVKCMLFEWREIKLLMQKVILLNQQIQLENMIFPNGFIYHFAKNRRYKTI